MSGVYKNEEGRQTMAAWYDKYLHALGPQHEFRSVETTFGTTNVLCAGAADKPTLVCFHGVMGTAPSALSLVKQLLPHFRIVFPDTVGQPGRSAETYLPLRGDAYARWAVEVLDGMQLDAIRMLGVSMGGYIALKVAEFAPERIQRLSLWVPGGLVSGSAASGLRLGWASLALYLFPGDVRMRKFYDLLFSDYDETWFRFYQDSFANIKMDRRMPQLAPKGAFDKLKAPVQVFANEEDVLFPAQALIDKATRVFPNLVEAEVLPGFKHVPPLAAGATDEVLARIQAFLSAA